MARIRKTPRSIGAPHLAVLLCITMMGTGCASLIPGFKAPTERLVLLTYQPRAYQLGVLLKDYGLKARVQRRAALPYSSNASTGIWLGKDFPHDKAIKVILLARNYYKDLRYIALSDKQPDRPEEVHNQIYVGGSTETALELKLSAWSKKDWEALKDVKSKAILHALIRARYRK